MKRVNREEFLKTVCPIAYKRFEDESLEVKVSQEDNTFYFQYVGNIHSFNEQGYEHEIILDETDDDIFFIFELEDMQYLILPLAEAFDARTKEAFR